MKKILLFEKNLFFSVSLAGNLKKLGFEVKVLQDLTPEDDMETNSASGALVNLQSLSDRGVQIVGQIRKTSPMPIIAFCGHAQAALMKSAQEAGATMSVPNSQIAGNLPGLLQRIHLL